jgi:cytochrome c oxidase subunit 2
MQMHVDKYERMWINAVIVTLAIFFASLVAGAVIYGVRPASTSGFINPMKLDQTEFAEPGVRHMGDNQYEVVMLAQAWNFIPAEVRVPVGADVTFKLTSRDVVHGFMIEETTVNLEVIPGHSVEARHVFDEAGEYYFQCHEYCGRGHQGMYGVVIVEEGEVTALADEE